MSEPKTAEVKVVPSGWRTMESAPMDGTHILACDHSGPFNFNQSPPTVVHWWEAEGEEGFYTSVNEVAPDRPFSATHWMPLPAAPGEAPASPPAETGEGEPVGDRLESMADDFDTLSVRTKYDAEDRALFAAARDDLRDIRAALSAQPVSSSEGEAVAWRYRWKGENHARGWRWVFTKQEAITAELRGYEVRALVEAHPASDQSDTERMRAALKRAKAVLENTAVSNALRMVGAHEIIDAALAEKAADQ